MNSPVSAVPATLADVRPQSRTGIRLLYAAFFLLTLLAIGFIVAIILVVRQLYLTNGFVTG